jgi:hypothetical protein
LREADFVLGDIAHSDEWLIPSTGDKLLLIRDKKWLHISGSTIIPQNSRLQFVEVQKLDRLFLGSGFAIG